MLYELYIIGIMFNLLYGKREKVKDIVLFMEF